MFNRTGYVRSYFKCVHDMSRVYVISDNLRKPKMVPVAKNHGHQLFQTYEKQNEIKNDTLRRSGNQFANGDEPLIEVAEEPGGRDPLLIDYTKEPRSLCILLNRDGNNAPRTYSKKISKEAKKIKVLSQLPLKDMIYEALEAKPSPKGNRPKDIRKWIDTKYGIDFDIVKIIQVLRAGLENGEISQLKRTRTKTFLSRYRLSKFNFPKRKCQIAKSEPTESLENSISFNITDVKSICKTTFDNDNEKKSCREFEGKESRDQKSNSDPVRKDEIDFMVLHSLCSSENPNGMLLDEIAEFIHSFYNIDAQRSLPGIETYLNYGIEKGVLFKNGDWYKKSSDTWELDSKINFPKQECGKVDYPMDKRVVVGNELGSKASSCPENVFIFSHVKLEQEEMPIITNSRPVRSCRKTNINYNLNHSMQEKRKTAKILLEKYGEIRDQFPEGEEQHIKLEKGETIIEPSVPLMQGKVNLVTGQIINAPLDKRKGGSTIVSELKALFQTVRCDKRSVNDSSCEEHDVELQKTHRNNSTNEQLLDVHEGKTLPPVAIINNQDEGEEREFNLQDVSREPRYSLTEISEYLSWFPNTVSNNPAATLQDLLWKQIELMDAVPCIKLIGIGISNNENLDCKICGSQLKFGPSYCNVCFFQVENIIEKCNICHFICNRGDVFHKHFLWVHRPSIQEDDYFSLSILEKNIEILLKKLAGNNLFRCIECTYSTNSIEEFESHTVRDNTTKINVFPPLPEVTVPDEVAILRNEIRNTCCYKCNECGFISNGRDYMVYHILDVHLVVENDSCKEPPLTVNIEPKKKKQQSNVKYTFGLCQVCGKFYNNVAKHLERHCIMTGNTRGDEDANNHVLNQEEILLHSKEQSLPLSDGVLKKSMQARKRPAPRKIKLLMCHICGKLVNRRLFEHLRIHSHVMYDCNICGRKFNRQSNLLTHRRVHTREKPFQCDICSMVFGYKCSIKGHIEKVHSETVR